jgi:ABC-2 type transport system permease protein
MLTFACVMLPGAALVREKERGTAEQLLVSPLTPLGIVVPKVLSMAFVSVVGTAFGIFVVLTPLVGLPCRGSVTLLLLLTAAYAATMGGLGILLATLSRTTAQLGLLTILTAVPLVQLSGLWNTIESMPLALGRIVELSPLRHFSFVVYGILIKGCGLDVLWPHALTIAAFGAALFTLAVTRFHAQFASGGAR